MNFSGIQFWETQVSKQLCDQKHKADNVQQELREMHRNYDEKITTLSSENAALQEECRREYDINMIILLQCIICNSFNSITT